MFSKELTTELKHIIKWALLLDIAVYIISVPFLGLTLSMLAGIAGGTIIMFLDMTLLSMNVSSLVVNANESNSGKSGVKAGFAYFFRMIIVCAWFYCAISVPWINIAGAVIPLFYPKLIYFSGAIFNKKGGV